METIPVYLKLPLMSKKTDITTKDFVMVIDALHKEFGNGYQFAPEPITEGGIQMIRWPSILGKKAYKSCRIYIQTGYGKWPRIDEQTLEKWRSSPEKSIFKSQDFGFPALISLKPVALQGAPRWTKNQLTKLVSAFTTSGFTSNNTEPEAPNPEKTVDTPGGAVCAVKLTKQEDFDAIVRALRDEKSRFLGNLGMIEESFRDGYMYGLINQEKCVLPCFCIINNGYPCVAEIMWIHKPLRRKGFGKALVDLLGIRRAKFPLIGSEPFWIACGVEMIGEVQA